MNTWTSSSLSWNIVSGLCSKVSLTYLLCRYLTMAHFLRYLTFLQVSYFSGYHPSTCCCAMPSCSLSQAWFIFSQWQPCVLADRRFESCFERRADLRLPKSQCQRSLWIEGCQFPAKGLAVKLTACSPCLSTAVKAKASCWNSARKLFFAFFVPGPKLALPRTGGPWGRYLWERPRNNCLVAKRNPMICSLYPLDHTGLCSVRPPLWYWAGLDRRDSEQRLCFAVGEHKH